VDGARIVPGEAGQALGSRGPQKPRIAFIAGNLRVVYNLGFKGGSNSVVECDLAKVEVAGSNPVSRSRFLDKALHG
jgi:hypothetical protein